MNLDLDTFLKLAGTAVEAYDNEIAYYQGMVAGCLYEIIMSNRLNRRIRRWLCGFRSLSYVDVLEWVEEGKLPKRLWWFERKLFLYFLGEIGKIHLMLQHPAYLVSVGFLNEDEYYTSYDLTHNYYNWLVSKQ